MACSKGYTTRSYTVWCGCGDWIGNGTPGFETAAKASENARKSGWILSRKDGWVCPECQRLEEKLP